MNAPPELILASTSPHRRMLMERLGLPFRAIAPGCDEDGLEHLSVEERATALLDEMAPDERADLYKKPQRIIMENALAIPL